MGEIMKGYCFALAALAAIGFSGAAVAGETIKGPTALTDAEMDRVVAGAAGVGNTTANVASNFRVSADIAYQKSGLRLSQPGGTSVGLGVCTAGLNCLAPFVPPPH